MSDWKPKSEKPAGDGAYLVFMPDHDIDRFSVHWYHHIDGWEADFGITHWMHLPPEPKRR